MSKNSTTLEMEQTAAAINQPSENQLRSIAQLAERKLNLERRLSELAEEVAVVSNQISEIENVLLPEQMQAVGMEEFTLSSGYRVTVGDFVRGSIPTESAIEKAEGPEREVLVQRRLQALKWLRQHKADSLIKNTITVTFGKGQDKLAAKVYAQLASKGYDPAREQNVNYQTLNAFLREQIRGGTEVPSQPFGLFVGKKAEIKAPRAEKKSK